MAKPKAPAADEETDDAPEGDEDEAWANATPRLKGLFKETLDEWMTEHAPAGDAATGDGAPPAGGRAGGTGGIIGKPDDPTAKRSRTSPRPSGGSILDVLLGR